MLHFLLNYKSLNNLLIINILTLSFAVTSLSQTASETTNLIYNQPVQRQIKGGETQAFQIKLKAGETARIEVVQKGIDVVVSLFAPDGKLIVQMDGKHGRLWRETVTAIADKEGIYRVEVTGYGSNDLTGSYQTNLFELRKTEPKDIKIQQAENAIEKGRKLFDSYFEGGKDYQNAVSEFEKGVKLWQELDDKQWQVMSLINLGLSLELSDEWSKANKVYLSALPLFNEIQDKMGESKVVNFLANSFYLLGQLNEARDYYERGIVLKKEANDPRGESYSLNGLGIIYSVQSQYEKAIDYYKKALVLRKGVNYKWGESDTLHNLGISYWQLNQLDQAIKYFEQALAIKQELKLRRSEASTITQIGDVYHTQKQFNKSLEYYQRALLINREFADKQGEIETLTSTGDSLTMLNRLQEAKLKYEEAYTICKEIGYKVYEGPILNELGNIYLKLNQPEKAKEYIVKSLIMARELKSLENEGNSLQYLMNLWLGLNQPQIAVFYGKQLINTLQQIRFNIKNLDEEYQDSFLQSKESTYRQLADLLISQGRFREAQQVLEMLKESEYFEFIRRDKAEIEKLAKRVDLTEKEKAVLETYLKLSDNITSLSQELQTLENKKQKLPKDKTLSDAEQARMEELQIQLKLANEAFQIFLDKELVAQLSGEAVKGIEFDKNLQNDLQTWGNGTVSVYTVLANNRYRAIVTTPFSQTDGKTEITLTELNKKIFTFREALTNPKSDPKVLGKQLYDILIKPIEKDLTGAKAKTIVWSLDGTLRYIPIAALWDGKQYLVEKYQNIVLTSATKKSLTLQNNSSWKALAGGVSTGQEIQLPASEEKMKFNPLPKVTKELGEIFRNEEFEQVIEPNKNISQRGILSGRILLDKDFNGKNLTDSLKKEDKKGEKRYNLIHLASHFWLGSSIANSFLVMGDNKYVTLEEIKNSPEFDLSGVELVTLSACNTGFNGGTGAEVDSLATLLESRGAKASLSSLWEVSDESTYSLMVEFYRQRKLSSKTSKAEALRQAQVKILKDKTGKHSHPFYWSPFVIVGNWR